MQKVVDITLLVCYNTHRKEEKMKYKTIKVREEDLVRLNELKETTGIPIIELIHLVVKNLDKSTISKLFMEG